MHGDGRTGALLVESPHVDAVYHVGSSATGRSIAQACARTGAHAVLEGGGKDACLVDGDVDPAWAAAQVALGAFANAGQICVSVERVYVHAAVAEPFLAALVGEAELAAADRSPSSTAGSASSSPATSQRRWTRAPPRSPAGRCRTVPARSTRATVLTGCTDDMAVMRDETFGPVAAVRVVGSFDEALAAAARSSYGLAATVLTGDFGQAQRAARELPVGTVKVNAVFGGAPGGAATPGRGSGQGLGYGPELLDELTRVKVVHWEAAPRR